MSLATPPPSIRRPYHGSCHCGRTRYVAFMSLPPAALGAKIPATAAVRFWKCNCSACHKMGFFHVRLPDPPRDFYLLAPADTAALSDYTCFDKKIHWFFCSACGVRCFAFTGAGETVEVDLDAALGGVGSGKMTKVWKCKGEGWEEGKTSYLTINAHTLEPGQEGLDLREVVDKKWVQYLDCKDFIEETRYDYPQEGGTW